MAFMYNPTIEAQIQDINALPLEMIKNSILKAAKDELNTKIKYQRL